MSLAATGSLQSITGLAGANFTHSSIFHLNGSLGTPTRSASSTKMIAEMSTSMESDATGGRRLTTFDPPNELYFISSLDQLLPPSSTSLTDSPVADATDMAQLRNHESHMLLPRAPVTDVGIPTWTHIADPKYGGLTPPPQSQLDALTRQYRTNDGLPTIQTPSRLSSSIDHLPSPYEVLSGLPIQRFSTSQGTSATSVWPPTPMSNASVDSSTEAGELGSASSCISSWFEYERGWTTESFDATVPPQLTVTTMSMKNTANVAFTTLCDNIPRAPAGVPEFLSQTYTVVEKPASTGPVTTNTKAIPTCSVEADQCFNLGRSYKQWQSGQLGGSEPVFPDLGPCQNYQHCDSCQIRGRSVQLFYWPVPKVAGGLCASNGSTITPTPTATGPSTIVTRGVTLTSPSVYLSFGYLVGISDASACGQPTSDLLVSIPPESLSSIRTVGDGSSTTTALTLPFNFADLDTVPKDAYQGMARCHSDPAKGNLCSTVYDDYNPHLVIPDAVRTLVPFWRNCDPCLEGVLDPPIALTADDRALVAPAKPTKKTAPFLLARSAAHGRMPLLDTSATSTGSPKASRTASYSSTCTGHLQGSRQSSEPVVSWYTQSPPPPPGPALVTKVHVSVESAKRVDGGSESALTPWAVDDSASSAAVDEHLVTLSLDAKATISTANATTPVPNGASLSRLNETVDGSSIPAPESLASSPSASNFSISSTQQRTPSATWNAADHTPTPMVSQTGRKAMESGDYTNDSSRSGKTPRWFAVFKIWKVFGFLLEICDVKSV